ncbi:hypothetical protein, partial [Hahella ganghwensis]|uniref:hypothetical protein n=1 Tax=Hahella ganghwensis TaxID=286420 RepID=UPI001B7FD27C
YDNHNKCPLKNKWTLSRSVGSALKMGLPDAYSKGAIEEYYPEEVTSNCSKPERALKVTERISSRDDALGLSQPLSVDRSTEFEEIFASIFGQ